MASGPSYFQDMLDNPEELDPELAECLVTLVTQRGTILAIKHRLVNEIFYLEAMNPRYNATLKFKRKILAEAYAAKDWYSYIRITERPWRATALLEVASEMSDTEYWQQVAHVWIDTENMWEWADSIEEIMHADRPCREAMMEDDDRERLDELPNQITVYRGHQDKNQEGWSWTTNQERACWFAHRFGNKDSYRAVTTGTVDKGDVIASFLARGEDELVIDPDDVVITLVEEL